MNPIDFPESNIVFMAGDNPNTRDVVGWQGKEEGGLDVCVLCFEPTLEERAAIADGASVWLVMRGETLRPVRLHVESPFADAPAVPPHMPMRCRRCGSEFMGCDCPDAEHAAQYTETSPVQACRFCIGSTSDVLKRDVVDVRKVNFRKLVRDMIAQRVDISIDDFSLDDIAAIASEANRYARDHYRKIHIHGFVHRALGNFICKRKYGDENEVDERAPIDLAG